MALRIRKDIDLKELEKFGFKKYEEEGEPPVYRKDFNNWHYIEITIPTRYICVYDDEDLFQNAINLFYDLVKADFIEKD